ncbi:hypothetical protein D3C77_685420 [compost metagenome]
MKIEREDVLKLMKSHVTNMWFTDEPISQYETACSLICGFQSTEKYTDEMRNEDIEIIMKYINNYDDFKIDNIYQIIYKNKPFNFMKIGIV